MKKFLQITALLSCVLLTACAQASAAEVDIEQTVEAEEQVSSGELHSFDEDLVKSVINPDGTDSVFLSIDLGKIMYFQKEENDSESHVAAMTVETYYDMQTKDRYREHFKFCEIDGLASEEALIMAQGIVDGLGISNLEEPQIFTCPGHTYVFDEDDVVEIKDSYYILYLADETKPYYDGNRGYAEFIISANGIVSFIANYICD